MVVIGYKVLYSQNYILYRRGPNAGPGVQCHKKFENVDCEIRHLDCILMESRCIPFLLAANLDVNNLFNIEAMLLNLLILF